MRLEKEVYNYIEFELNHYDYYKKLLKTESEKMKCSLKEAKPYNPMLPKELQKYGGISLIPSIFAAENSINAIDLTLSNLSQTHRKIFEELYQNKRKDIYFLCNDLNISHETFKRYKKAIIYGVGINLGVIKAFDQN